MIAIDYPYVSEYLVQSLIDHDIPVIDTPQSRSMIGQLVPAERITFISASEAAAQLSADPAALLYTNSENCLSILGSADFPPEILRQTGRLKNKLLFRDTLKSHYPGFFYTSMDSGAFDSIDPHSIPYPCVVKPAVGFFSVGVRVLHGPDDWTAPGSLPPGDQEWDSHVVDTSRYIIEEGIDGDEYAVDAYFTETGKPVIMGIYSHLFASENDVGDRIYTTSADLLREYRHRFTEFLTMIGSVFNLKSFPIHAEVRISPKHGIIPIEINPLRFGGWCTTADFSRYAYGYNQYEYYFNRKEPDWTAVTERMGSATYSLIVLDNSTGIPPQKIASFDTKRLLSKLSNPLEFRPIDYRKHNVFGFVFARSEESDIGELHYLLQSDLKEFTREYEPQQLRRSHEPV